MKLTEVHAVFMSVAESAGLGNGATIIEVFTNKEDAEKLRLEIYEKVKKNWSWDILDDKERERIKDTLLGTVEIISLHEAIDRIKEECYEDGLWADTPGEEY
jgi:predicted transcriptional regulator